MKRRKAVIIRKSLRGRGMIMENKGPNSQALRSVNNRNRVGIMPIKRVDFTELKGEGVVEDAYNWFSDKVLPKTLPSAFKTKLKRYANYTITSITVGRDPVNSVIQRILNILTLGKYDAMKRKLYYDDVFHLYAIIRAQKNGQNVSLKLEKNNVVVLKETADQPKEYVNIALGGKTISLGEFIGKTMQRMSEVDYVRYDAVSNNCQRFISEHLRANGLMTPEADKFINQDIKQLLSDPAYGFSKVITDIGNIAGHLTGGSKRKKNLMIGGCECKKYNKQFK